MQPNLPFLSFATNAILKPGGPLKSKKWEVKNVMLSLPFTKVMKIVRLTSPLPDKASFVITKAKAEAWQATCSSV